MVQPSTAVGGEDHAFGRIVGHARRSKCVAPKSHWDPGCSQGVPQEHKASWRCLKRLLKGFDLIERPSGPQPVRCGLDLHFFGIGVEERQLKRAKEFSITGMKEAPGLIKLPVFPSPGKAVVDRKAPLKLPSRC